MKSAERCTAVQRVEAAFVSKWPDVVEKGIFEDGPLEVVDCLYLALAASKKSDGQARRKRRPDQSLIYQFPVEFNVSMVYRLCAEFYRGRHHYRHARAGTR
jgi:hypothetical protein